MPMIREQLLPTDADVEFFGENGYWFGPKVLDDGEIAVLREHVDLVCAGDYETGNPPWSVSWQPGDDPQALRKIDNAHWADLTFRRLALNETIAAMAARLLGVPGIRLWHDQLLYKPGSGKPTGNVGWHQDYNYWQCSDRDSMITAWVPFDDVTVENGCMLFVPRSHRWGLLPESDFFNQNLDGFEEKIAIPEGEKWTTVPVVLKAGEVSFHHSMTIHGSGPNVTDKPRRNLVIHMMSDGTAYRAGSVSEHHMNALLLNAPGGTPYAGEFFPLLYPAARA